MLSLSLHLNKFSPRVVMLQIISLSTLIFATAISKIEENRFVFWGTVSPNENISAVLDITIPRHGNPILRCGAECRTRNNCSGMDICEEMGRCRIWKTTSLENLNLNESAVQTCRRYLKVYLLEIERNHQQSTMKINDSHTTESTNLLETSSTNEPAIETSNLGATTTIYQSLYGISTQIGSSLDPETSESSQFETTTVNELAIQTSIHAATTTKDFPSNEMSSQKSLTTANLQTIETSTAVEPINKTMVISETSSFFDTTSLDLRITRTTSITDSTDTDLQATEIPNTEFQLSTEISTSTDSDLDINRKTDLTTTETPRTETTNRIDLTTTENPTTEISSLVELTTTEYLTTDKTNRIDLTTTEIPTTEISSLIDIFTTENQSTEKPNLIDSTTTDLQTPETQSFIHSTTLDPATSITSSYNDTSKQNIQTTQLSSTEIYSPASSEISVIETSTVTDLSSANPSSEETTTERSDLSCIMTYEFSGGKTNKVPCLNDTFSWILIQRRYDGSTSFYRSWTDYENGFGSATSEIWLGNQYIHELTTAGYNILRIELTSFKGEVRQIEYDFTIEDKVNNYRLHIAERGVSNINSLAKNDLALFSTYDNDNDNIRSTNCAELLEHASGWWHSKAGWCTDGNLNGIYSNQYMNNHQGIYWFEWDGHWTLKETKMMLRKQ